MEKFPQKISTALARAAFVVVAIIVVLGLVRVQPFVEMLIFGIALAVAVVPEALPAVVTISLAIGIQKMVKRNALIRRLPAVETLGSTSVICSDKTGTLTKDEMTVRKIFAAGQMFKVSGARYSPVGEFSSNGSGSILPTTGLQKLLAAATLASDTRLVAPGERDAENESGGEWNIKGDPTEGALVVAAAKVGLQKASLDSEYPRVHEIPFSSETKRMTTLHQTNGSLTAYAKGAPEMILDGCDWQLTPNSVKPLDDLGRKQALTVAVPCKNSHREKLGKILISFAVSEFRSSGKRHNIQPMRQESEQRVAT